MAKYQTNTEILLDRIRQNTSETTINAGDIELSVDGLEGCCASTNTLLDAIKTLITAQNATLDGDEQQVDIVSGTVTANLSATDNAVLDAIDTVLDNIKVDTEAIETATEAIEVTQNRMVAPTSTVYLTGVKAFTGPFYAITALTATVIDASEGDTNIVESDDSGTIQDLTGTLTIPAGVTLYGNFAVVELDSGTAIGYAGAGVTVTVAS